MKNSFLKRHSFSIKVLASIFIIAGLVLPLHQAQAFFLALATSIAGAIAGLVFQIIVIASYGILIVSYIFLSLVTSPSFINLPYTSGGIVGPGWEITRNFANMGFAFALLVIGLATALRIGEYHAKKTLPRLIGMILLINFTPVICGLVVDASNIIMNFFIEGISSFSSMINLAASQLAAIMHSLSTIDGWVSMHMDLIARSVTFSAFCILTAFFFFLFSVLFIMRYVAIWVLVILSPLAFFANVLPNTKKLFTAWWDQFFQWCIVGVTAAFFLYLAEQLLVFTNANPVIGTAPDMIWVNAGFSILGFDEILKFAVIDVFLLVGFLASLSSGATGANAVIKTTKGWGKTAVGSWKKGTGAIGQAKKGMGALGERAGREILSSETIGGKGGFFDRMGQSKNPLLRQLSLKGKELKAGMPTGIDSLMKDKGLTDMVKTDDLDGAMLWANSPKDAMERDQRMVAVLAKISEEKGDVGLFKARETDPGFENKALEAAARMSPDHLRRIVGDSPTLAMNDIVRRKFLTEPEKEKGKLERIQIKLRDLATKDEATWNESDKALNKHLSDNFGDWRTNLNLDKRSIDDIIAAGESDSGYQSLGQLWSLERTVRGLDTDAITKLSPQSINNPLVQDIIARTKSVNHISKIDEKYGSEVSNKFAYDAPIRVGVENMARENPQMLRAAFLVNQQAFTPLPNSDTGNPFKDLQEVNDFIADKKTGGGGATSG